jgi:hypothetical protein
MRAIDIGDEMQPRPVMVGRQRQRRHRRTEIRPADADIDHVGERLAGCAEYRAVAHPVRERAHRVKHRVHLRHHVLAIDADVGIGCGSEGGVQNRAAFRRVDRLARKHPVPLRLDTGCLGQSGKQRQGLVIHRTLGEIHPQIVKPDRVTASAAGIRCESRPEITGRFPVEV